MNANSLDPGLYFRPFTRQLRSRAAQYAYGQTDSTERPAFRVPHYWSREQTGQALGTSFEVGLNVPDPAGQAEMQSFYTAFQTPEDGGRMMMEKLAARPQHVNLENPSGQAMKTRLDLPYESHSRVDILKAVSFMGVANVRKAFSHSVVDSLGAFAIDEAKTSRVGAGMLEAASRNYKHFLGEAEASMDKVPWYRHYAEASAERERDLMEDKSEFVRAYGGLMNNSSKLFGMNAKPNPNAPKEPMNFQRTLIENVIGPQLLFGMQVLPLIKELGHKLRHHHEDDGAAEAERRSKEHHNLETPIGKILKRALGLPYKAHSEVDPIASANFFHRVKNAFVQGFKEAGVGDGTGDKDVFLGATAGNADVAGSANNPGGGNGFHVFNKVRRSMDLLEEEFPELIGNPRNVMRAFYDMQTSAYAHFAASDNKLFSTVARSMLYAEHVEHRIDYTYKFSPSRLTNQFFRAIAGVERRDYEKLALEGLEHSGLRRAVKVAGLAVGLVETIFRYEHAYQEWKELKEHYLPARDPAERRDKQLDRERRKEYREARRKGYKFDPTSTARRHPRKGSAFKEIWKEMQEQFSVKHQLESFQDAFQHPKQRAASLITYAAFAGMTVHAGVKGWQKTAGKETGERVLETFGHLMHGHSRRMQISAGVYGLAGMFTSHSWAARGGALANVIATVSADTLGGKLGERFVQTEVGRDFTSKAFLQASRLTDFFELSHPKALAWAAKMETYSTAILNKSATTVVEKEALAAATKIASNVGMEAAGLLLEGTLLIPIRSFLRHGGQSIDNRNAIHKAKKEGKRRFVEKTRRRDGDYWLKQYLNTYVNPAYSERDFYLNPKYNNVERMVGLWLRRDPGYSAILDQLSPHVTAWRRITSAVQALRTTRWKDGGKQENWRSRLIHNRMAAAFTDSDIASNAQYSVRDRVALSVLRRTEKGKEALDSVSDKVTKYRNLRAWADALTHHDDLADHVGAHAHKAVQHAIRKGVRETPALGVLSDTVQDTRQTYRRVVPASIRKRLRIRSQVRAKDAPLDESKLHEAYSRYINYGHEGNTLTYDDSSLS